MVIATYLWVESLMGRKAVVSNRVDKSKPPRLIHGTIISKELALKWAHMLQTATCCHISKTSTGMELLSRTVSSYRIKKEKKKKHIPDLLSKTEKQLQHQIERLRHTSQDQRAGVGGFFGRVCVLAESPLHSKTWQGLPRDLVRRILKDR